MIIFVCCFSLTKVLWTFVGGKPHCKNVSVIFVCCFSLTKVLWTFVGGKPHCKNVSVECGGRIGMGWDMD